MLSICPKKHALFGKLIDAGGLDLFLSVTTKIGIAKIVSHNKNDIRFLT